MSLEELSKIFEGMTLIRKSKMGFLLMLFGQCQVQDQHLGQKIQEKINLFKYVLSLPNLGVKNCVESPLATKIASLREIVCSDVAFGVKS